MTEIPRNDGVGLARFPRGREGLAALMAVQNQVMLEVYPAAEQHMGRLVTGVDQIRWISPTEIEQKRVAALASNITFRLFQAVGIAPPNLKRHFLDQAQHMYELDKGVPVVYMSRNVLNKLEDVDSSKRLATATQTASNLLEINFNLLPVSQAVPESDSEARNPMLRRFRQDLDKSIESVVLDVGDRIDADELEVIEDITHTSLYYQDSSYQPRVVSKGGLLVLVLPGQDELSAESIIQINEDKAAYYHLAQPILDGLISLIPTKWQTTGGGVRIGSESPIIGISKVGERLFRSLGVSDSQEAFDLYVSSRLGTVLFKEKLKIN